jgi:hypothetical protein
MQSARDTGIFVTGQRAKMQSAKMRARHWQCSKQARIDRCTQPAHSAHSSRSKAPLTTASSQSLTPNKACRAMRGARDEGAQDVVRVWRGTASNGAHFATHLAATALYLIVAKLQVGPKAHCDVLILIRTLSANLTYLLAYRHECAGPQVTERKRFTRATWMTRTIVGAHASVCTTGAS